MRKKKFPRLEIRLDGQVFHAAFANVDDVLRDDVWHAATASLHEIIKGHFRK